MARVPESVCDIRHACIRIVLLPRRRWIHQRIHPFQQHIHVVSCLWVVGQDGLQIIELLLVKIGVCCQDLGNNGTLDKISQDVLFICQY